MGLEWVIEMWMEESLERIEKGKDCRSGEKISDREAKAQRETLRKFIDKGKLRAFKETCKKIRNKKR